MYIITQKSIFVKGKMQICSVAGNLFYITGHYDAKWNKRTLGAFPRVFLVLSSFAASRLNKFLIRGKQRLSHFFCFA